MKQEKVIDLRELLYYVLKKWRKITIVALALALLVGMLKFASGFSKETFDTAQLSEEDQAELEELTEDMRDLQADNKDLESQIEYNNNSILMKIDPFNKFVASFTLYIDSNYKIIPSSYYQDTDTTDRIITAYYDSLTSNEFYNWILDNTKYNSYEIEEIRYLNELIDVSIDWTAKTIAFSCAGDSEERTEEITGLAKQFVEDKYIEISSVFGNHECTIWGEASYSTVDYELYNTQKENLETVSESEKEIAEIQAKIDEITKSTAAPAEQRPTQLIVNAIKGVVVGGIIGVVLTASYYMVTGVLSRKMWCETAWLSSAIPVLGEVFAEKKSRKFEKVDKWIDKAMGYAVSDTNVEECSALAAANIIAMLKEKGTSTVAVIGKTNSEFCSKIIEGMNNALSGEFRFVGDILTDTQAVSLLADKKEIVLLANGEQTTIDEVEKTMTLLKAWGKELLGVILVK